MYLLIPASCIHCLQSVPVHAENSLLKHQTKSVYFVFTLSLMCIEHCMLGTFLEFCEKNPQKNHSVGYKSTTFALLEQMSYHKSIDLAQWLEAV